MGFTLTNQTEHIEFDLSDGNVYSIDKANIGVKKKGRFIYVFNGADESSKLNKLKFHYSQFDTPTFSSNDELMATIIAYKAITATALGDVRLTDGTGTASIDHSTNAQIIVEQEHHEIHEGDLYRAGYQKDVSNGGTAILGITTPDTDKEIHFRPAVDVELEARVQLVENPDTFTGGTITTPRNSNRNSLDSSVTVTRVDPTVVIGSGVLIGNVVLGSRRSSGGNSEASYEWVLKRNTNYALIVINEASANNETNIRCNWYEHTPKN